MTTITIIDESTQGEKRAWNLDFLDETMTLRASGRTMHLGKPATSRIWVRRLEV